MAQKSRISGIRLGPRAANCHKCDLQQVDPYVDVLSTLSVEHITAKCSALARVTETVTCFYCVHIDAATREI